MLRACSIYRSLLRSSDASPTSTTRAGSCGRAVIVSVIDNFSRAFDGSDQVSRVGSGRGDPSRPVMFQKYPIRSVRVQTLPAPPRLEPRVFSCFLTRSAGRVMTRKNSKFCPLKSHKVTMNTIGTHVQRAGQLIRNSKADMYRKIKNPGGIILAAL